MKIQAGDTVAHWQSNRTGIVLFVGTKKMVIDFDGEEEFRWISAFKKIIIDEENGDSIWLSDVDDGLSDPVLLFLHSLFGNVPSNWSQPGCSY